MKRSSFDRRWRPVFAAVVVYAVTGCTDAERQDQRRLAEARIAYDYDLLLPEKLSVTRSRGSIARWKSGDHPMPSSAPISGCIAHLQYAASEAEGVVFLKRQLREDPLLSVGIAIDPRIPVTNRSLLNTTSISPRTEGVMFVSMFAWCDSELACEEALSSIREVRILLGERPGSDGPPIR